MYNIHLLPAAFGDSILIEYGKKGQPKYMLIDGGPYYNYPVMAAALKKRYPNLKEIELLIVTHIDIDHIDGIVRMLNEKSLGFSIKEAWFNGLEQLKKIPSNLLGFDQGDYLSILIKEKGIPQNKTFFLGAPVMVENDGELPVFSLGGGMKITLFGPQQATLEELRRKWEKESEYLKNPGAFRKKLEEDRRYSSLGLLGDDKIRDWQNETILADDSLANRSSISFVGEYEGKSCLFSGDSPSEIQLRAIEQELRRTGKEKLKLDCWKLAHHGSKKSTTGSLMAKIDAEKILLSSNGDRYAHPEPQTLAKLLKYKEGPVAFYFNYRTKYNEFWDKEGLRERYGYETNYGDEKEGISVSL